MNIRVTCSAEKFVKLGELKNFQGGLKVISRENINRLKRSIIAEGFSFPVFVWRESILDGHQRLKALLELLAEGGKLAGPGVPCVEIYAENAREAAKKLLLVNSAYGEITGEGLTGFIERFGLDPQALGEVFIPQMDPAVFEGEEAKAGSKTTGHFGDEKEVDPSREKSDRITVKSIPAFLGAFCLHQAKKENFKQFKAWKAAPVGHPDFGDKMVEEITEAVRRRRNYWGAVTVPPPNAKRGSYEGYPIGGIAARVAQGVKLEYVEAFEVRRHKTRHGVGARTHQDQEAFVLREDFLARNFGAVLLVDDVCTTRFTIGACQVALSLARVSTTAIVYYYWGNV